MSGPGATPALGTRVVQKALVGADRPTLSFGDVACLLSTPPLKPEL